MKKQLYSTLALLVCLATAAHAALSVGGTGTGTLDIRYSADHSNRVVNPFIWGELATGTVTDAASMDTYISAYCRQHDNNRVG